MFVKIFLVLCLFSKFLFVISWKPTADYCNVKCKKKGAKHTACNCKLVAPRKIIEDDNPKKFRQEMVDVHNRYRNQIASGGESKKKKYPEAANMMAISYSLELEYIAKCHAGVIDEDHDKCRNTVNLPSPSGQNLGGVTKPSDLQNKPDVMAKNWYDELDEIPENKREAFINKFSSAKEYVRGTKPIGHFSQFIWWSHSLVGCARVHNEKNSKVWQNILICNYAGTLNQIANFVGKPVYKAGTKCSECPGNTQCNNTQYPALCGTIAEVPGEKVPFGKPTSRTVRIYQNKLLLVLVLLAVFKLN